MKVMRLTKWLKRKNNKIAITDKNALVYLEIFGDGKFRMSSDKDMKQKIDLPKKDKIEQWEERWAKRK